MQNLRSFERKSSFSSSLLEFETSSLVEDEKTERMIENVRMIVQAEESIDALQDVERKTQETEVF